MRELSLQDVISVHGAGITDMSPSEIVSDLIPWASGAFGAWGGYEAAVHLGAPIVTWANGLHAGAGTVATFAVKGTGAGIGLAAGFMAGKLFDQFLLSKITGGN